MIALNLTPSKPITVDQKLDNFESAELSLNEWLKKRAYKNHAVGASRCFVLCAGADVIGYHNQGIGQALLRDAMMRAVNVSGDAGVFALLVHALSDQAKQFYLSRGFVESPLQSMTLFMTIETVRSILVEPDWQQMTGDNQYIGPVLCWL